MTGVLVMQIVAEPVKKGAAAQDGMSLVEVGPRVCLQPIKIFAGSFGGPVLYENPSYVSPNKVCTPEAHPCRVSSGQSSPMLHADEDRPSHALSPGFICDHLIWYQQLA